MANENSGTENYNNQNYAQNTFNRRLNRANEIIKEDHSV